MSTNHSSRRQHMLVSTENQLPNDEYYQLAIVGKIAAGIAHEVRNPLTAVRGFLQLLKEKAPHEYIDIAQQELENAINTLQNLLNLSKPNAEDEPMVRFSICSLLESVLNLFQDQKYRITIDTQFEDREAELFGRMNQLKKAFFNVIKNAVEAIPEKGSIRIRQFVQEQHVCVIISDTGIGIPKDKLTHLGTPFFTTKQEGTGLGLSHVFSTVYLHGGSIQVASEVGTGTTITIQLPLDSEARLAHGAHNEHGISMQKFLSMIKEHFLQRLLEETKDQQEMIENVLHNGNIDLIANAQKLVDLILDHKERSIISFAQEEGKLWAHHPTLNLASKLKWFQTIRRVLWSFIHQYERLNSESSTKESIIELEKQFNSMMNQFSLHFLITYTRCKEEEIEELRKRIDS